jgi:hypothetical protein
MADLDQRVPFLSLTIEKFNPNHRVRFLTSFPSVRYLFDLSTAVGDDSFYLFPKLAQETSIQEPDQNGGTVTRTVPPTGDVHMSFHESGAVNIHTGGIRRLLRSAGAGRGHHGLAVRLVFNKLTLFQPAPNDDANTLPKRYTTISVTSPWDNYPLCLDIYQVGRNEEWTMPSLADLFQFHVRLQPERKQSDYHFLVWQHTQCEQQPADVVILHDPLPVY